MTRPEMNPDLPGGRSRRQPTVMSWGAGLLGVAAVVCGTFLPWVRSGAVDRNLYAVAGVAQRLGLLGAGSWLSGWLPLLGPICIVPVLVAILRLYRSAAVLGLLVALACGGLAATAIGLAADRSVLGVRLAYAGPVMTLAGAVLLAGGAIAALAFGASVRGRAGDRPHGTAVHGRIGENGTAIAPDPPH